MISQAHRYWLLFQRQVWNRRLPHGLVSPRYVWPGSDVRVSAHRRLWWASGEGWPRPLWLFAECWLWLRWVTFWSWIAYWRFNQVQKRQKDHDKNRPPGSYLKTFRLSLAWCIPPRDIYLFNLHLTPEKALDFIYDHELSAWHRLRSQPLGLTETSGKLLQDKVKLSELLSERGVPMAPILCMAPRNSRKVNISHFINNKDAAFCKMRSGNQGRGAFAVWKEGEDIVGRTFKGQHLPDTKSVEKAWHDLLKLDDALIQPCLTNHPSLASLGLSGQAITIRWISEWKDGCISCLLATLEVPTHCSDKDGSTLYTILPIESETGQLKPWPDHALLPIGLRQSASLLYRKVSDHSLGRLPYWVEIADFTNAAHKIFPDIRTIAWDWVITPAGPILLEGNSGWGTKTPQMLLGGFLLCTKELARINYGDGS